MEKMDNLTDSKLTNILQNETFCDVVFLLKGENGTVERIAAHRLILAISSEAFATMFYGSLPEQSVVEVDDISPDAFRMLLKYAYSDSSIATLQFSCIELAIATAYAAKKYLMGHLFQHCSNVLKRYVSRASCFVIYEASLIFDDYSLTQVVLNFILDSFEMVFYSEEFLKYSCSSVLSLTRAVAKRVHTEQLFTALVLWGVANKGDQLLSEFILPFLVIIPFIKVKMPTVHESIVWSLGLSDEQMLTIAKKCYKGPRTPDRRLPDSWINATRETMGRLVPCNFVLSKRGCTTNEELPKAVLYFNIASSVKLQKVYLTSFCTTPIHKRFFAQWKRPRFVCSFVHSGTRHNVSGSIADDDKHCENSELILIFTPPLRLSVLACHCLSVDVERMDVTLSNFPRTHKVLSYSFKKTVVDPLNPTIHNGSLEMQCSWSSNISMLSLSIGAL